MTVTRTWTFPADLTPAEVLNIRQSAAALERRWRGTINVETIERFMAESLELISRRRGSGPGCRSSSSA